MQNGNKQHNWRIVENKFDPDQNPVNETLFALGNGYLGMRGNFEEGLPGHSLEGTFINGFYESEPITYGEKLYGFAENRQTMLTVANSKIIKLYLDEEEFSLLKGRIIAHERCLDMQAGVLRRSVQWQSPRGKQIELKTERLILHKHRHNALIRYSLTPLNFSGRLKLHSLIDANGTNLSSGNDPRVSSGFKEEVLFLEDVRSEEDRVLMQQRTKNTNFLVACGIKNMLTGGRLVSSTPYRQGWVAGIEYVIQAEPGVPFTLDKYIAYVTSLDTTAEALLTAVTQLLETAAGTGFEALKQEQHAFLEDFWYKTDVVIEGDDRLQKGIRFNIFHLLQSTGRNGRTNIAAKGLTGHGYEGHYFWDTEMYILPFFLYSNPQISRKLLEYRYHTLEQARQRARQMAHRRGALYPWRTINGQECSAFFPSGTAQYHIDADIAFAIKRYYQATEDDDFLIRYGAEILFETARLWADVGAFTPSKGNQFCINGVTGPDEYTCVVNNNAYTNLMARENLLFAAQTYAWLKENAPEALKALAAKIGLQESEPALWQKAAEHMYLPYDEARQIIPQDDSFLHKPVWDFENTPPEHSPLLLHYHPLVLYRYQVCKQPDLVLAQFLLNDQFDQAQKQRDYDYYERITTHDSSLSTCIFGIMAAELGYPDKAYTYFVDTATTDLDNKKGNTKDGIHAANMAGAWMSVVFGFAGMRVSNGLAFNPMIPDHWQSYAFKILYKKRLLQIEITHHEVTLKLLHGDPIDVKLSGETIALL